MGRAKTAGVQPLSGRQQRPRRHGFATWQRTRSPRRVAQFPHGLSPPTSAFSLQVFVIRVLIERNRLFFAFPSPRGFSGVPGQSGIPMVPMGGFDSLWRNRHTR